MPYKNKPFNYFGASPYQVRIDLENANNNFDILANAFKNNNPDTGIVKEALKLDGFIPSQTPQPNAIPVSYDNGKIDLDWLPDDLYNLAYSYIVKSITVDGNDNGIGIVSGNLEDAQTIHINFKRINKLVLNTQVGISFVRASSGAYAIDIKGVISPTLDVPQYIYYSSIKLLPNHTVYEGFSGFWLGDVLAKNDIYFQGQILLTKNRKASAFWHVNMIGAYSFGRSFSDNFKYVVPVDSPYYGHYYIYYSSLITENTPVGVNDFLNKMVWTYLGTIDFGYNTYDGFIDITLFKVPGS